MFFSPYSTFVEATDWLNGWNRMWSTGWGALQSNGHQTSNVRKSEQCWYLRTVVWRDNLVNGVSDVYTHLDCNFAEETNGEKKRTSFCNRIYNRCFSKQGIWRHKKIMESITVKRWFSFLFRLTNNYIYVFSAQFYSFCSIDKKSFHAKMMLKTTWNKATEKKHDEEEVNTLLTHQKLPWLQIHGNGMGCHGHDLR